MYKTIRRVHLWFSVPLGLVMALLCLTGLVLLFEPAHIPGGERSEFFLDVMRLHRWLFDAPEVKGTMTAGKMIVAISACCFVVSVVTGIWLWCLRARRNVSRNLKLRFNSLGGFFTSLHTVGGIYIALFLLVMALTGLTWSFGWYRELFTSAFNIPDGSHIIYQIHTGAFGGIVTHIIWFITALIGLTLPISGYYMWLRRIMRR